jgi:hypothetical protein
MLQVLGLYLTEDMVAEISPGQREMRTKRRNES